jgi:lysophospholipase L1-like esterase
LNIVAVGDSETAGGGAIGGPPAAYPAQGGAFFEEITDGGSLVMNLGLPGNTARRVVFGYDPEGGPTGDGYDLPGIQAALLKQNGTGRTPVVTVWLGTNDLTSPDPTAEATLEARMTTILKEIRALTPTPRIAVFTLPARTGDLDPDAGQNSPAAFWAESQEFNAWVRSQRGILFDAVVDLAANPILGDAATCSDPTWYVDGLHQTAKANAEIIAPLWENGILVAVGLESIP